MFAFTVFTAIAHRIWSPLWAVPISRLRRRRSPHWTSWYVFFGCRNKAYSIMALINLTRLSFSRCLIETVRHLEQFSHVSFAASSTVRRHRALKTNLLTLALGCWDASVLCAPQQQRQPQPQPSMHRANSRTAQSTDITSSSFSSSEADAMTSISEEGDDGDSATAHRSMLALLCSNERIPRSVRNAAKKQLH